MNVKDYVIKSLIEYPSLYKDVDWEKSRMKILNHVFLTKVKTGKYTQILKDEKNNK